MKHSKVSILTIVNLNLSPEQRQQLFSQENVTVRTTSEANRENKPITKVGVSILNTESLYFSVQTGISVFKDTPHFTNTVRTFLYGLRRLYYVLNTARISYRDLNIYSTGPYTII